MLVSLLCNGAFAQEAALKAPPGPLKMIKPRPVTTNARESLTGQLFPSRMSPLGFEVGGRLQTIRANKGDQVKIGQVVGQLDPEIADAQVAQAEAGLAAAEAGAELASDVAARNEKLKAEGSVSDLQTKNAMTTSKQAAAQVLVAKAQVAQARAARKRHDLKSPINGTVVDSPDQIGGLLGPGLPVFIIQQLDVLTFKTTVSEGTRGLIKAGLKVHLEAVNGGAVTDDATVKVVIPSADPATRRIPVEITVPNPEGKFVAMTLAKATLPLGDSKKALAVPASALGTSGGEHLFSVDAAGTLHRVPVTVLERTAREVIVLPSEPIEQAVDYPTSQLTDGAKVSSLKGPT